MNKDKVIEKKRADILGLEIAIDFINNVELNKMYRVTISNAVCYGYIESFNENSCRFIVIAGSRQWATFPGHRYRNNITSIEYTNSPKAFLPVKRSELLTCVAMEFKDESFSKILEGKTKIKFEED